MVLLEGPIKDIFKVKNYINGEWVESEGNIQARANVQPPAHIICPKFSLIQKTSH